MVNQPQIFNQLFLRKLLVAFVVGFSGPLLTFLTGLGTSPEWHLGKAAIVSLLTGALAAGVRAALALSPINLVPSDAQHSVMHLVRNRTKTKSQHGQINLLVLVVLIVVIFALGGGFFWSPWAFLFLVVVLLLFLPRNV